MSKGMSIPIMILKLDVFTTQKWLHPPLLAAQGLGPLNGKKKHLHLAIKKEKWKTSLGKSPQVVCGT